MLFDLPVHLADAPSFLMDRIVLGDSSDPHLYVEFSDGVDDGRKDDSGGQVRWREDAERCSVVTWSECPRDFEVAFDAYGVVEGSDGFSGQDIVDLAELAIGRSWEMSWEEVGEGERVDAFVIASWFGEEVPLEELVDLGLAVGTVLCYGLLGCDCG